MCEHLKRLKCSKVCIRSFEWYLNKSNHDLLLFLKILTDKTHETVVRHRWGHTLAMLWQQLTSTTMGTFYFILLLLCWFTKVTESKSYSITARQASVFLAFKHVWLVCFCIWRMSDLLVGAPMFIVRGSDGHLEEMGRVYVYLQRSPLKLELRLPHPTGTQMYGRFGSSIAALGDLNQDGFNGKNKK